MKNLYLYYEIMKEHLEQQNGDQIPVLKTVKMEEFHKCNFFYAKRFSRINISVLSNLIYKAEVIFS